ncbi:hypothetical protein HNY73_012383 [Argiope bruennichi]|uniref:Uncharacterized protein n=1 Tax=Argiope bruennichi TaxID=94029 RepID=A0A8T0EVB4_ARGBR|nr:hypothetical protein HNY73_012383 [Argiope bruennichi]
MVEKKRWCMRSLANCLKLKSIRKESLSGVSFGSVEPVDITHDVGVKNLICSYDPDQLISIEVLIADTITSTPVAILNTDFRKDYLYFGADNVMEAFALSSNAETILRSGVFKLRKLRSNNSDFRAFCVKIGFCESEEGVELKVMGLNWNPGKDVLSLEVKGLVDSLGGFDNTKSFVLQIAARNFDPMVFIAPFVVRIKFLLQEIWKRGMDWDDNLSEDYQRRDLKEIVIPRNCLQD